MLTILSKKDLIDERYLKTVDMDECKEIIQYASEQRSYHRENRNGYSPDKNRRETGAIPATIYWNPKFRHIFHNVDAREGQRLRREFLQKYSKFRTVDKL